MGAFENKLRNFVPPSLVFNKEGLESIAQMNKDCHRVSGLSGLMFSLHRIRRQRRKWIITYYARDSLSQAVAEFRLTVGEIKTEDARNISCTVKGDFTSSVHSPTSSTTTVGLLTELTSFLPAKTAPLVYGLLEPCIVKKIIWAGDGSSEESEWMVKSSDLVVSLTVEGINPTSSYRIEVGLNDVAAEALKAHCKKKGGTKNSFEKALQIGEQRRFIYADNWKVWPKTITIRYGGGEDKLSSRASAVNHVLGTYERAACRHTVNQNGLWVRKSEGNAPTLYLLIKPEVSRTGPDTAIISTSLGHDETSCILAYFPVDWQPCDALEPKLQKIEGVRFTCWSSAPALNCFIPKSNIQVSAPMTDVKSKELIRVSGLSDPDLQTLCRSGTPCLDGYEKINFTRSQSAQQSIRCFNSVCVAPILKHAATKRLLYDLSPDASWVELKPENDSYFGCCQKTVPPRPIEHWHYDQEREAWERRSEPGASRNFYLALQAAPQAFEFFVDKTERYLKINLNPEVAAHHATSHLILGRGETLERQVTVQFRLSSILAQADPVLDMFKVYSCDRESPTVVQLKSPHKLYLRQQKAVTKMLAIEDRNTEFEEIELSEHTMPGATGWSVMAKASRGTRISGGVIADAIGKTKSQLD